MKYTLKTRKNCYKKIQLTFIALVITTGTFAQVGIGTPTPEKSALLDLASTTQGLLPPRLTYAQRNSMILPIPGGLMVWCIDCGSNGEMQVFDGINWTNMGDTATAGPFSSQLMGSTIHEESDGDLFGYSVSLSANGNRMAIGAPNNDANGENNAGHVRLYDWNGSAWVQVGDDIDGEAAGDHSGFSVALSANGNRVAIGAYSNDDNGEDAGHVRIYDWNGSVWIQVGHDIDGEAAGDYSGRSVALSDDGNRVAIGGTYQNDDNVGNPGHVRLYDWNGSAWMQVGNDIDGEAAGDYSGWSVALSANGNRVAIGAHGNDDHGENAGHVRLYDWNGSAWVQVGGDIDGEAAGDGSGQSIALSADGNRVAIGAYSNDDNGEDAGHVRIYDWIGSAWVQVGNDIDGESGDKSGFSVSLSADGMQLAIGALENDNNGDRAGHVQLFDWNGSAWVQIGDNIIYNNQTGGDFEFGRAVSISGDGARLAIGSNSGFVQIFQ